MNILKKLLLTAVAALTIGGIAKAQCNFGVDISSAKTINGYGTLASVGTDSWTLNGNGNGPVYYTLVNRNKKVWHAGGYHFVYTPLSAPVEEDAEMTYLTPVATAGLVEADTQLLITGTSGLPGVALEVIAAPNNEGNLIQFMSYASTVSAYTIIADSPYIAEGTPIYLKLIPNGGGLTFTGEYSTDDVNWTVLGTTPTTGPGSVSLTGAVNEGLSVFNGSGTTALATAIFNKWLIGGVDPTATGPDTVSLNENNANSALGFSFQTLAASNTLNMSFAGGLVIVGPQDCTSTQLTQMNAIIASVASYNGFLTMSTYDPNTTPVNYFKDINGTQSTQGPTSANSAPNQTLDMTVTATYPASSGMASGSTYDAGVFPVFQFYNASGGLLTSVETLGYGFPNSDVSGFNEGWFEWELAITMSAVNGTPTSYTNVLFPDLHWQAPLRAFCYPASAPPDFNPSTIYSEYSSELVYNSYWIGGSVGFRIGGAGAPWFFPTAPLPPIYAISVPWKLVPSGGFDCTNKDLGINPLDLL
jgi:hypothetical protein